MSRLITTILACSLFLGCSRTGVIPFEDVEIVCVSGHEDHMEVFFKVPEGVQCAGVQIAASENVRVLTFVEDGNDSDLEISSKAVVEEQGQFAGSLRVEIPIPAGLQSPGSEFILKYAGDDTSKDTLRFLPDES